MTEIAVQLFFAVFSSAAILQFPNLGSLGGGGGVEVTYA